MKSLIELDTPPTIYLASASPRRQELLQQIGVPFALCLAPIDETPFVDEGAADFVVRMAKNKANAAADFLVEQHAEVLPVLAADTIVVLDGVIFGKPRDTQHASEMLAQLAGQTHEVMTAVCVWHAGQSDVVTVTSRVTFQALSAASIAAYVATGEPLDKAGAYAVQGKAAAFIRHLAGSYSGVMGLPLHETAQLLACVPMR